MCLQRWIKKSANVIITKLNATKIDETRMILKLAETHGVVGGIFNLALVLRDALMENQTVQNYTDVCESKVNSTKNLDVLSRELCPALDWFVCFSSESCGRGNAGQSNYGYANSVMERICEDRFNEGLPGLAIQWGAIGDVGIVQETIGNNVVISGTIPQRIRSCLSVLDKFLQQKYPVVSCFVPYKVDKNAKNIQKHDMLTSLGKILGITDISSINPESNFGELGMDSLVGVEIKHYLEHHFNLVYNIPELRQLKLKDLKGLVHEESTEKAGINTESQSMRNFLGYFHSLSIQHLIPTQTVVHMNTISTGVPLIFVHPVEGSVHMLQSLADLIPYPVYGIQCTPDSPTDSVEALTASYWELIKPICSTEKFINLAGYSFGTLVSFEMALQAESYPKTYPVIKSHVMLDGSPVMAKIYQKLQTQCDEREKIEQELKKWKYLASMFSNDIQLDINELRNLSDVSEKICYTANKIAHSCQNYRSEDIQTVLHLYNKKLEMISKYASKSKLKSDVSLIKASESITSMKMISDTYDLNNVCEGKINVYTVDGNHQTFILGNSTKKVADIMIEILNQ